MAAKMKKYLKLLTGLVKSGNSPESDATAILSILCFIIPFDITMLDSSSFAPSDSATKYSSPPNQITSSSSYYSLSGDISTGFKNFI